MRTGRPIAVLVAVVALFGCDREPARMTGSVPSFVERTAEPREPSTGRPPLLVVLHGIGADEDDLFPIVPLLDPRLKVVSLRAPHSYVMGYAWFHIDFRSDGTIQPDVGQAKAALSDLVAWVVAAPERHGTDPAQTYLLGFSQGAMMSLGVLQTAPTRLAGVIALSGRTPSGLFEVTADRDAVARVPLLVAHGTHDDVLPIANGRATRDAYEGWSTDFSYHEFPVAHGVTQDEIRVVADWLRTHLDAS